MKYCRRCGCENADAMSFCGQCGTRFAESPNRGETPTVSYIETPTVVRRKDFEIPAIQQDFETPTLERNFSAAPKRKNGKIFLIFGAIAVLFLAILAAIAGAGAYFYWTSRQTTVTKTNANISQNAQVSFTPPNVPTKKGNFTVYANSGWQISDIYTVSQENFSTNVSGKIDLAGITTDVLSDGVTDEKWKSRRLYAEFPTGALLMRTRYADGKFSNIAAVTAGNATGSWQNYPGERGKLEFCVNDNAPEKNGGKFTVTVTLISVPKTK